MYTKVVYDNAPVYFIANLQNTEICRNAYPTLPTKCRVQTAEGIFIHILFNFNQRNFAKNSISDARTPQNGEKTLNNGEIEEVKNSRDARTPQPKEIFLKP